MPTVPPPPPVVVVRRPLAKLQVVARESMSRNGVSSGEVAVGVVRTRVRKSIGLGQAGHAIASNGLKVEGLGGADTVGLGWHPGREIP